MQLASGSSDRFELRCEIKFALPYTDIGAVRRVLMGNCKRLIFNEQVSTVRSIYFDDFRFSNCYDNFDGIGRRSKLRIRWYDQKIATDRFYVEIKCRNNQLTGKHRIPIQLSPPMCDLNYSKIKAMLSKSLPDHYQRLLLTRGDQAAIVEYKREHFVSANRQLRITLDYNLVYFDQTGRRKPSFSFGIPDRDFVVLEAKMKPMYESQLRHLLNPLKLTPTRCSKYSRAIQSLGLALP